MTRILGLLALIATAAVLGGCAHPISLSPNLGNLTASSGGAKVDKAVGLLIPASEIVREVTSGGGGGDSVRYQPYRDLEAGLYLAVGEAFTKVTRVSGPSDPKISAEGLNYVLTPMLTTISSSPSMFTWPPTQFSVEIKAFIDDAGGKRVAQVDVRGEGRAEFDEFKSDTSLSARRAAEDALKKFVLALKELRTKLR
jgi:hypothetical protein